MFLFCRVNKIRFQQILVIISFFSNTEAAAILALIYHFTTFQLLKPKHLYSNYGILLYNRLVKMEKPIPNLIVGGTRAENYYLIQHDLVTYDDCKEFLDSKDQNFKDRVLVGNIGISYNRPLGFDSAVDRLKKDNLLDDNILASINNIRKNKDLYAGGL